MAIEDWMLSKRSVFNAAAYGDEPPFVMSDKHYIELPKEPVVLAGAFERSSKAPDVSDLDVPPAKSGLISEKGKNSLVRALQGSSLPPAIQRAFFYTYAYEGGKMVNPKTGSVCGITKETFADMKKRYPKADLPKDFSAFTGKYAEHNIVKFYEAYFSDIFTPLAKETGHKNWKTMVNSMPDTMIEATVDTLYQFGRNRGVRMLQNAANKVLSAHGEMPWHVDGKLDAASFEKIRKAGELDYKALLEALYNERIKIHKYDKDRYNETRHPKEEWKVTGMFPTDVHSPVPEETAAASAKYAMNRV